LLHQEQLPVIFNPAVAIMQRTVADCTVPACTACNKAMVKTYEHTMAVYKSFRVTAGCESASMEKRSAPSNNARKVIQQIALYFEYVEPPAGSRGEWRPKTSHRILLDCALWRCLAFLKLWSGGNQRMRLIAVFYASFYIHTAIGSDRFDEWHTRVWRPYCMENFESGTFLGLTQPPIDERAVVSRLQHIATKMALLDTAAATPVSSVRVAARCGSLPC
jgi:hypothetical protein